MDYKAVIEDQINELQKAQEMCLDPIAKCTIAKAIAELVEQVKKLH